MINRNTAILTSILLLLVACEQASRVGGAPFLTTNPVGFLPRANDQEYISICYNADTTTRQSVEALATKSCKKNIGAGVKFFSHDLVYNDCPVVTKAGVTFLCQSQ